MNKLIYFCNPVTLDITSIVKSIFAGILNVFMGACASIIDFTMSLISGFGLDFTILQKIAPNVIDNIYLNVFVPAGIGIAIFLVMTGAVQFVFPFFNKNSLPADSPIILVVRFAVALLMTRFLADLITDYITPFAQAVFNQIVQENEVNNFASFANSFIIDFDDVSDVSVTDKLGIWYKDAITLKLSSSAAFCVTLIMMIYLIIVLFKYLLYHIEMLIQTTLLVYCAPLVGATFTSKQTSSILFTWLKMIIKNLVCLIFNVVVIVLAQTLTNNGMSNISKSASMGEIMIYYILLMLMLIALLNVGKKLSMTISQLFQLNGMGDAMRGAGELAAVVLGSATLGRRAFAMSPLGRNMAARRSVDAQTRVNNAKANSEDYLASESNLQGAQANSNSENNNPTNLKDNVHNSTQGDDNVTPDTDTINDTEKVPNRDNVPDSAQGDDNVTPDTDTINDTEKVPNRDNVPDSAQGDDNVTPDTDTINDTENVPNRDNLPNNAQGDDNVTPDTVKNTEVPNRDNVLDSAQGDDNVTPDTVKNTEVPNRDNVPDSAQGSDNVGLDTVKNTAQSSQKNNIPHSTQGSDNVGLDIAKDTAQSSQKNNAPNSAQRGKYDTVKTSTGNTVNHNEVLNNNVKNSNPTVTRSDSTPPAKNKEVTRAPKSDKSSKKSNK